MEEGTLRLCWTFLCDLNLFNEWYTKKCGWRGSTHRTMFVPVSTLNRHSILFPDKGKGYRQRSDFGKTYFSCEVQSASYVCIVCARLRLCACVYVYMPMCTYVCATPASQPHGYKSVARQVHASVKVQKMHRPCTPELQRDCMATTVVHTTTATTSLAQLLRFLRPSCHLQCSDKVFQPPPTEKGGWGKFRMAKQLFRLETTPGERFDIEMEE